MIDVFGLCIVLVCKVFGMLLLSLSRVKTVLEVSMGNTSSPKETSWTEGPNDSGGG